MLVLENNIINKIINEFPARFHKFMKTHMLKTSIINTAQVEK